MLVSVAGNIGSGKTTLTTLLAKHYKWKAQFEDVENVSMLDQIVGTGTPESCTFDAFVSAVALGGFITFADGNSEGETEYAGGGAVWVRGGRLKILHCRFVRNKCAMIGPDVGGAAVRVLSQYENRPVYVVDSVFGGNESDGNIGSNGGGLSSIGVSFTVINSLLSHNQAIDNGGNPAEKGTPGGGSGAAIYNDGNEIYLNVCGTAIHDNHANQHGGSIFFVSNNGTGIIYIENSGLWNNYLHHWLTHDGGISYRSDYRTPTFTNSIRSDNVIIA